MLDYHKHQSNHKQLEIEKVEQCFFLPGQVGNIGVIKNTLPSVGLSKPEIKFKRVVSRILKDQAVHQHIHLQKLNQYL